MGIGEEGGRRGGIDRISSSRDRGMGKGGGGMDGMKIVEGDG